MYILLYILINLFILKKSIFYKYYFIVNKYFCNIIIYVHLFTFDAMYHN